MLDLSHRRELDWLARLVAEIHSVAPRFQLLLVGALARDLLLYFGHGLRIERLTMDADFALAVSDWAEFSAVREALLASGTFVAHPRAAHTFQHAELGRIDLIPFGAVERSDATIAWPPTGDEVMEVLGYAEAAESAVAVALPMGHTVRVVSLPMLAVLKVFAWSDRHRSTQGKDAVDLGILLRSYLEAGNIERLWAEFPHMLADDFDFATASAWLLGYDARAALARHSVRFDQVIQRLDSILVRELSPDRESPLVAQLNPLRTDEAIKLLRAFYAGLSGASRP